MIDGQFTWRGEVFGLETGIEITAIKGLESLPAVDYGGSLNARQHGGKPGLILAQDRIIDVDLEIAQWDTGQARRRLKASTGLSGTSAVEPLRFQIDGVEKLVYAQLVRRDLDLDLEYFAKNAPALQWRCPDPRVYGIHRSGSVGVAVPGAGLPYDFPYPSPYVSSPGSTGELTALNDGNEATPPVATITATKISSPGIRLVHADGSVQELRLDVDVVSGETLTFDIGAGTATVNGVDRYVHLSGAILEEMLLRPGATTVQLLTTSATPDALLTLEWADAEM